jgi:hypothetical protein
MLKMRSDSLGDGPSGHLHGSFFFYAEIKQRVGYSKGFLTDLFGLNRVFSGKNSVKEGFSGEELGTRVEVPMREDEERKKIFTESGLKAFDGRDGSPVCVAYQGKVYDVSKTSKKS